MRSVRMSAAIVLLVVLSTSNACTARYSQALAARIPQAQGKEVTSSDAGFSLFQIVLSEPKPAHEQAAALLGPCKELTNVEVDYRELLFVIIGFPRVTVTGTCVQ